MYPVGGLGYNKCAGAGLAGQSGDVVVPSVKDRLLKLSLRAVIDGSFSLGGVKKVAS